MEGEMLIWGTGNIADIFMQEFPDIVPAFFIDSNKAKNHTQFLGYEVLHPDEIDDWSKYVVIIATDYYHQIMQDYSKRINPIKVVFYKEYMEKQLGGAGLLSEVSDFLQLINNNNKVNKILFFGDVAGYDKGILNYLNLLAERENGEFVLFSEVYGIPKKFLEKKIKFTYFTLPKILSKNFIYEGKDVLVDIVDVEKKIMAKKYLLKAATNLRLRHSSMNNKFEYVLCYYADVCVRKILEKFSPRCVIVWNEFSAFHIIVAAICREFGIATRYMEFGLLPGSFSIDTDGQMGESYPARYPNEFNRLEINEESIINAEKLITFLCEQDSNRYKQDDVSELESIMNNIDKDKPIVFVAGQNDFESSLQPYDLKTARLHSPIFTSSIDCVSFLAQLGRKNGWNVIFKPHPIMTRFGGKFKSIPKGIIVAYHCNVNRLIDICDVCVTILSQVSYNSLLRGKPTVMLGYNQLKGSMAVYNAFAKEDIEKQINEAINNGFTLNQQEAFVKHIARLCNYYLFDDLMPKKFSIGRGLDKIKL